MAALMERIVGAFTWSAKAESPRGSIVREDQPSRHMVGKYHADYSSLTDEQLNESDKEMEALLRRSRVVSEKRGL
ncbi:MAG: hypothetical protein E5Y74_09955 [Mesorhizobium sp.]|uniref:hypothetical protein n=1 Tax=unclassified Mesorhizobium TaxID=325217 RepID=UPI000FE6BFEA|nr:hypothetical protein [Mesorhizobium sp.]RWP91798.1 MAG: hypothetical protein EOR12_07595 [Mesorhizobium sp.]TIM22431.1 MAG: hypothetical protein E5Y74_09955 [Mesorhizobium sp.]TIN67068.1 MAG: hypothetical protein E5Y30_29250 [Mesorhizobium sp.]TIN67079.1 MAG: hypothetical protein E5Y29_26135 [Mesorhizobium sp.]